MTSVPRSSFLHPLPSSIPILTCVVMIYSLFFSLLVSLHFHLDSPPLLFCSVLYFIIAALLWKSYYSPLFAQPWTAASSVLICGDRCVPWAICSCPVLSQRPATSVPLPWPPNLMLGLLWESLHAFPLGAVWWENISAGISRTRLIWPTANLLL